MTTVPYSVADLDIFKGGCKPPRAAKLSTLAGSGGSSPRKFCDFNPPKVDFEASGTYFGSIDTSLANDAMSSCSKGVGLTINLLVCVI